MTQVVIPVSREEMSRHSASTVALSALATSTSPPSHLNSRWGRQRRKASISVFLSVCLTLPSCGQVSHHHPHLELAVVEEVDESAV